MGRRSQLHRMLPFWAIVILALSVCLSVLVSPLPSKSLTALWPLASGMFLYLLVSYCAPNRTYLDITTSSLLLLGALVCMVGLFSVPPRDVLIVLRRLPLWERLSGAIAGSRNPNVVAGALVVMLPFALVKGMTRRPGGGVVRWLGQALGGCVLAGMVLILYWARSRGAYVAVASGLLVLVSFQWPSSMRWVAAPILLAGLVGGTILGWEAVGDALLTTTEVSGYDVRAEIWARALQIIQDFSFTGVGLGCFEPVVAAMYPLFLGPAGTVSHAHNIFLQVAIDLGLPGLFSYLLLLGGSLYAAVAGYRISCKCGLPDLRLACTACVASLTGMIVHGMIDSAVWGNRGAFVPWIVMGLSVALWRIVAVNCGPAAIDG